VDLHAFYRYVMPGLLVKFLYRVKIVGRENLPKKGGFILAIGPHTTDIESAAVAVALSRYKIRFFAKAEYWKTNRFVRFFMNSAAQIPIDRQDSISAHATLGNGALAMIKGDVPAFYPEGTRNRRDKFLRKGRTGVAFTALSAAQALDDVVWIVPIGLIDFDTMRFPWQKGFVWRRWTLAVGQPIVVRFHKGIPIAVQARGITDEVMHEISRLSERPYRDEKLDII